MSDKARDEPRSTTEIREEVEAELDDVRHEAQTSEAERLAEHDNPEGSDNAAVGEPGSDAA